MIGTALPVSCDHAQRKTGHVTIALRPESGCIDNLTSDDYGIAMRIVSRRVFLGQAAFAAFTACGAPTGGLAGKPSKPWRAAIIGRTGHGDYGHGLDMAFEGIERVIVVGLADPDPAGRSRGAQRAKAQREYADYREMLEKERPNLVVVAPRWSEPHFEMASAALRAGAHLLTEKPFTANLAEADTLLATAKANGLKIGVAHQMRLAPSVTRLQTALRDGLLGDLVHLRAWGKQDVRAGGEDMIVLGTHIFDMMRLLVGDARSCSAQVYAGRRRITHADARAATEKIGLIAGDEIEAQFEFVGGVTASFTSRRRLRETLGPWGIELLGSRGTARILMDIDPVVLHRRSAYDKSAPAIVEEWGPLADDPSVNLPADQRGFGPANRRVVLDWLDAIEHDREPQCSGYNAMKALEMAMAVYQAALGKRLVALPLSKREHPLA
jgi:predicted dehydrogenase